MNRNTVYTKGICSENYTRNKKNHMTNNKTKIIEHKYKMHQQQP